MIQTMTQPMPQCYPDIQSWFQQENIPAALMRVWFRGEEAEEGTLAHFSQMIPLPNGEILVGMQLCNPENPKETHPMLDYHLLSSFTFSRLSAAIEPKGNQTEEGIKQYTEADLQTFKRDEIGFLICPSGDYTQIEYFPANCRFGKDCSFGEDCSFGKHCSFGKQCSFGEDCSFGKHCSFGKQCSFGEDCSFDKWCHFGEHCTFGTGCTCEGGYQLGKIAIGGIKHEADQRILGRR